MSENSRRPEHPLDLDVVVPVHNEERSLEAGVRALHDYLTDQVPESWRITIADNASTDATGEIADRLASQLPGVATMHLEQKGRGRALKQAWMASPAAVVAYVDVDLSTDLAAVPPLVAPLLSGHSDIAIGTRLDRGSRVVRGGKREFISRSYNAMLHLAGARFSDAQCGFKAMRGDVAHRLLPLVEDTGWFFDTELLLLSDHAGLRIHEVPVDWIDDPHSTVDIVSTAAGDVRGLARVWWNLVRGRIPVDAIYAEFGRKPYASPSVPGFFGQALRFGAVGVVSTLAYALLYLGLEHLMAPQAANFVALLATAVANTWANRRFTFGVHGSTRAVTHQVQGLVVFGIAWVITSASLLALHVVQPDAASSIQLIVLTIANLVATVLRFVLLRVWVFRRERRERSHGESIAGRKDVAQDSAAPSPSTTGGARPASCEPRATAPASGPVMPPASSESIAVTQRASRS